MDLADVAGNVKDGCHIASMGGFWMAIVYGFAGMRDYGGKISFRPTLLPGIDCLRFRLKIQNSRLDVYIENKSQTATYTVFEGEALTFHHEGEKFQCKPGKPLTLKIKGPTKESINKKSVLAKK